jgi:hypothetical protein
MIKNPYFRTIFLAILATVTFVGSAIFIFEVDPVEMWEFFQLSVFVLGIVIFLALCFTVLRIFLKRLFDR